jgi:hypothetical protein
VIPGQQTLSALVSPAPERFIRVSKTAITFSVTMFFIYGNLNFVPGGYDPVRIIPFPFSRTRLSISVYVLYLGPSKTPWHPFHPLLPPP